MRVLVTGATGFLGRHLVEAHRRRGHEVLALVRPHSQADLPPDVEAVRLDLRAPQGLADALAGVDVVVHAAAVKSGDFHSQYAGTVVATRHLVTAMAEAGVRRLVLVSSFSVYDYERVPRRGLVDESAPTGDPVTARDAYAATKLLQEDVVREVARDSGWSVAIARPGVIYGPGNLWSARLGYRKDGRWWAGVGSRAELPLTYVANCADALAHLAEHDAPGVAVVNIVDDDPPTLRRYRAELIEQEGRPDRLVVLPWPVVRALVGALEAVNRILGRPLQLPGALSLDSVVARWKPLRYSNERLRALGWRQPVPRARALAEAVGAVRPASDAG